jgi:hypothetical protein
MPSMEGTNHLRSLSLFDIPYEEMLKLIRIALTLPLHTLKICQPSTDFTLNYDEGFPIEKNQR